MSPSWRKHFEIKLEKSEKREKNEYKVRTRNLPCRKKGRHIKKGDFRIAILHVGKKHLFSHSLWLHHPPPGLPELAHDRLRALLLPGGLQLLGPEVLAQVGALLAGVLVRVHHLGHHGVHHPSLAVLPVVVALHELD